MSPPTFGDLGKQARDLFSKNYHFGLIKLDVKTKTPAGVEFTVNGNSNNDTGRVNASLETKYYFREWGFTLKEKWNTDNTLATELSLEDQLLKGSKLAFSANFAPQSGKKAGTIKSGLKSDHFNASADVDLDYGGAIFHGAAVLGYDISQSLIILLILSLFKFIIFEILIFKNIIIDFNCFQYL